MTFLDWLAGTLLALALAVGLTAALGSGRSTRGQGRVDAILLLAAAVLIALVVILWLVVAR